MQQERQNNAEMERLAGEIRKLGVPFSSPEPDQRYWANFRVRVMERVAEEAAPIGWWNAVGAWLQEHVLATGLVSAAAAVVISLMVMQPTPQPAVKAPIAQGEQRPAVQVSVAKGTVSPVLPMRDEQLAARSTKLVKDAPALAALDDYGDQGPVSLDELSAPELQSVLESLSDGQ